MTSWLQQWWHRPDHFEWFTSYVVDRHLQRVAQLSIAGVTAAFAAVALFMLASPAGPHTPEPRLANGAAGISGMLLALLWLTRWPTRHQSRLYVAIANTCIAAACLAQSDPIAGLTGCYTFVVLGGYATFLHSAKAALATLVISMGVVATLLYRIVATDGDTILALSQTLILAVFSLGAPIALNTVSYLMAADAEHAERDPLTGLLNRRGFDRHTRRLIDQHAHNNSSYLTITIIDLDHFKHLNDQHGHPAGDHALIDISHTVGRILDTHRHLTVLARMGGEEFLIAEITTTDPPTTAAHLCQAIAERPHGVTASIGTTSIALAHIDHTNRPALINHLITHADTAMYTAKTNGGNHHHHHPLGDDNHADPNTPPAN